MQEVERLKRSWAKGDNDEIDSAIFTLLAERSGRRFLWWLLEIGKVGTQPYAGNAIHTAFACGELNIGQKILDRLLATSPDGYVLMMKENADEYRERTDALNHAADADRSGDSRGGDPFLGDGGGNPNGSSAH